MSATETDSSKLAADVGAIDWYHTLELAPGLRTPGWLDHAPILGQVPFPESLAGMRCLDVATFNGYWAFEMERRGAAEVIGIDVLDPHAWDWPYGSDQETIATMAARQAGGRGFEIAKEALGSSVERLERSVYELDAADIGEFDVVYVGSLLVHLRDPVRALERVRSVCKGRLVVVDGIDLPTSLLHPRKALAAFDGQGRPWWFYWNAAGLAQLMRSAGFEVTEGPRRIFVPPGASQPRPPLRPSTFRTRQGRLALTIARKGDPHAALVGVPRR